MKFKQSKSHSETALRITEWQYGKWPYWKKPTQHNEGTIFWDIQAILEENINNVNILLKENKDKKHTLHQKYNK